MFERIVKILKKTYERKRKINLENLQMRYKMLHQKER